MTLIGEYQSSAALISMMRVHVRLIRRSRHIERSFDLETIRAWDSLE